jgi:hypothetical protein
MLPAGRAVAPEFLLHHRPLRCAQHMLLLLASSIVNLTTALVY